MAACTDAPWPVSDVISGHDKKYKIISSAPPKFSGSPVVSHRTTNEGSLDNGQLEHIEVSLLWTHAVGQVECVHKHQEGCYH